jgi:hypothetical protein
MLAFSMATAASASARLWPGDPVPEPAPAAEVIDTAATGTPALWLLLLVAAATALVVGSAAYVAGSRRRDRQEHREEERSLEVSAAALG